MIKQLFRDSSIYGVSSILSQGIPIIIVPIYTRILSPDSYGCMDILFVFAALINVIIALEISQGLARSYADAKSEREKIEYISSSFLFTLVAYFIFVFLSLLFATSLTRLLLDSLTWENTFRIATIAIAANGIFYFLQNLLRWQLKPKGYAASSIAYAISSTSVAIFLIVLLHTGVVGVFYGQIVGALTGGTIAWYISKEKYKLLFVWDKCKEMMCFSLPLVPSSISVLAANYIDRVAIKSMMSLGDVGIYGVGFRFASIVNLLMVGFCGSLTPLLYHHYKKESTAKELKRIFSYFLSGTIPLIIAISLFSKEILWILTTPKYYAAWAVIPVLAISSVLMRMYIFAPGLDIAKKTKLIALINISTALINIFLNFKLIPVWGLYGAALATLISSLCMFLSYMFFSQKFYPVKHNWLRIFIISIFSCFVIVWGIDYSRNKEVLEITNILYKLVVLFASSVFIVGILSGYKEISIFIKRWFVNFSN